MVSYIRGQGDHTSLRSNGPPLTIRFWERRTHQKASPGKTISVLEPVVANKRSRITDYCNLLNIVFRSGLLFSSEPIMMALHTGLKHP